MEKILFMDEYREDLLLLYNQLLPHENLKDNDKITEVLDKIKRQEGYNIILGLVDNVVVSTCTLIILPNITHQQKPYAIIENVVTHKEYQKKGYATAIVHYAIDIAKESKCHKILLQTRRKEQYVHKFYKKLGFSGNETMGYMINFEKEGY